MSAALTIIAVTTAVAGQQDVLRTAQQQLVAETLKEPGCLRYELSQSLDDPRILVFTESWASEKDWRAHMQGDALQRFRASGASRLIEDFRLLRLSSVTDGTQA